MMSYTFVSIVIIISVTTILYKVDAKRFDRILDTDLWTNTNYQISGANEVGFNLLTYADTYTAGGEKYVQLDDHQERKEKYSVGGAWFNDGLWNFKLEKIGEPYVFIEHVLYPGYKLVVDSIFESPSNHAPNNRYLILSNSEKYNTGQEFARNGLWEIVQLPDEKDTYLLKNFRGRRSTAPRRFGNDFYKWVAGDEEEDYPYKVTKQA